ncbi:MAG: PilW family protein [Candidatus Binatia bacterium]
MKRKAFSRKPHREQLAGFSLVELLVAMSMIGLMLAMVTGFVFHNVETTEEGRLQTEAQQGLRALLSMVTQELRQAGACLAQTGQFVALAGMETGDTDTLTVRVGKVDPVSLRCAETSTVAGATTVGDTQIIVTEAVLFEAGDRVYITASGATGNYYYLDHVDTAAKTLTLSTGLVEALPATGGAGVYAIEERTFSVSGSTLTLSIDGGGAYPLVDGVEVFDVLYYLKPCTLDTDGVLNCTAVISTPPAGDAQWNQIAAIGLKATVRSHKADKQGNIRYATTGQTGTAGEYVTIKPRNFL